MKKEDRRNSDHKGPMARFVAEPVHTGQTSQGTAHPCRCEQHRSGILHLCFLALDLSTPNSRKPATFTARR